MQVLLAVWGVAQLIWAQWPKPHSEKASKIFNAIHSVFLMIVTHSSAPGTFTWPAVVRWIIGFFATMPQVSPISVPKDIEITDKPDDSVEPKDKPS